MPYQYSEYLPLLGVNLLPEPSKPLLVLKQPGMERDTGLALKPVDPHLGIELLRRAIELNIEMDPVRKDSRELQDHMLRGQRAQLQRDLLLNMLLGLKPEKE